jgi:two-component system, NarL family, nitrate/nitrite response regulator NarL
VQHDGVAPVSPSSSPKLAVIDDPRPIRVLVVDDHDLFRVGLASVLAAHRNLEVVAQASGGKMAVRLARELQPDVVLMDLRMPDLSGPAATEAILADNESVRVVALTVMAGESDVAAAVSAGACGYLLKDSAVDDVVVAIRAAASGTAWLSPRAAEALLEHVRRDVPHAVELGDRTVGLSPRETGVLELVARGLENNEIAANLTISPHTVKNHVSSILGKLGVTNRIQAAIYAVRHQLD